jgi:hypothetical protein
MTLTYVVEQVKEIDRCYEPDLVTPIGTFETQEEAVTAARAFVPDARAIYKEYARITVQGWQQ